MKDTMLAWRAKASGGALELLQCDLPELQEDEALVKVSAAGVSPVLMKLLRSGRFTELPTTLGHEIAGTVTAVGGVSGNVWVGRRVRVHPMLSCRSCEYCLTDREQMCDQCAMVGGASFGKGPHPLYKRYHDGGLAEYVRVPLWLLDELPANMSFPVAAKLHDVANAYRALKEAHLPFGATLVITAATGAMATSTLKLAPHFGVARVVLIGRSRKRLSAVEAVSGAMRVDSIALEELPQGPDAGAVVTAALKDLAPDGVDAVLDFLASGDTAEQAMYTLRLGGSLVHMGGHSSPLSIPLRVMMNNLWRLVGTRACTRADVWAVFRMFDAGTLHLEELVTHSWPLSEADEAFAKLEARKEPIWMGVVTV